MAAPVLKSFAQRLYDGVAPLAWDDANQQYALAWYCAALGQMFQVVDDYGRDQIVDGRVAPGWSQLLDPDRAPAEALPWLAQFVGATTQTGLSDAAQRQRVRAVGGWNRGTPASIIAAVQQLLTGQQRVILHERDTDPYHFNITVFSADVPVGQDATSLKDGLLAQNVVPAGLQFTLGITNGQDYQYVFSNYATYQTLFAAYLTYQGVVTNTPGT